MALVFYNSGQITVPTQPSQSSGEPSKSTTSSRGRAATPVCTTPPAGVEPPWLYAVVAQNSSEIVLYFTDAGEPYDHYALVFGTQSGEYTFGATNIGSNGTRVYRVSDLRPNTTYYFKVRAGNGCATGEWSNELSATTKSLWSVRQLTLTTGQRAGDELDTTVDTLLSPTPIIESNQPPELRETRDIRENQYTVRVIVTDPQGMPIEGSSVTLQPANRTRVTDENGSIIFTGVEPGNYQITVSHEGYRGEQSIAVEGSEQVIELQIQIEKQDVLSTHLALWGVGIIGVLLLMSAGLWWVRR